MVVVMSIILGRGGVLDNDVVCGCSDGCRGNGGCGDGGLGDGGCCDGGRGDGGCGEGGRGDVG